MVAGLTAIFVELIFRSREEQEQATRARLDEDRHKRHLADLQKAVFSSVLGQFAPPWLSDKVVDLYKTRVLREGLKVSYTFEPPPDDIERLPGHKLLPSREELLMLTVDISYRLRNLTDENTGCEIRHGFAPTVPLPGATCGFTKLEIIRIGNSETSKFDRLRWFDLV